MQGVAQVRNNRTVRSGAGACRYRSAPFHGSGGGGVDTFFFVPTTPNAAFQHVSDDNFHQRPTQHLFYGLHIGRVLNVTGSAAFTAYFFMRP
jgi:hypothetical protein